LADRNRAIRKVARYVSGSVVGREEDEHVASVSLFQFAKQTSDLPVEAQTGVLYLDRHRADTGTDIVGSRIRNREQVGHVPTAERFAVESGQSQLRQQLVAERRISHEPEAASACEGGQVVRKDGTVFARERNFVGVVVRQAFHVLLER